MHHQLSQRTHLSLAREKKQRATRSTLSQPRIATKERNKSPRTSDRIAIRTSWGIQYLVGVTPACAALRRIGQGDQAERPNTRTSQKRRPVGHHTPLPRLTTTRSERLTTGHTRSDSLTHAGDCFCYTKSQPASVREVLAAINNAAQTD